MFEGNRSLQYIGLALFMEREFFHITRNTAFGKPRPDPRIKLFDRKAQEDLRRRIMKAAGKYRVPFEDASKEWAWIVGKATDKATEIARKLTDAGRDKSNPLTVGEHSSLVVESFAPAFRLAAGYVHEREVSRKSWTAPDEQPNLGLDFEDCGQTILYVILTHPKSDLYKIGHTTDLPSRLKSYNTHSPEHELIAAYPETEEITERKVHLFFAEKREKREFFKLSESDLTLLKDPQKLRVALKNAE